MNTRKIQCQSTCFFAFYF